MGLSGTPLNLDRQEIIDAIKKHHGVISHVCKALKVHHESIYKRLRGDEELQEILSEARKVHTEKRLDVAENALDKLIENFEKDPSTAAKAIFFFLNNKGKERGYNPPEKGLVFDEKSAEKLGSMMSQIKQEQEERKIQS